MSTPALTHQEQNVVRQQVSQMLGQSRSLNALPAHERQRILDNTAAIVDAMVVSGRQAPARAASADPYALQPSQGLDLGSSRIPGQRQEKKSKDDFGRGIDKGVQAAGALLREVDFPNFVSSLVQGVFKAVVASSIEQMKAYGELVQSVAMSLNDFRDQNVSPNQGRDHLVSKYPNLFQVNIVDGQPRVGMRSGVNSGELPDFQSDLGLSEPLSDLDDESIEAKLVPAARDNLARSRQQLLSTMVLMGINRIIVTDGKINAKLRFNFSAQDSMTQQTRAVEYENLGMTSTYQGEYESGGTTGERSSSFSSGKYETKTGSGNYFASGAYQATTTPLIRVTDQSDTNTQADLAASAQLTGEVSLNFKSETFPLEKMIDTNQIARLQQNQASAGRGAPPTNTPTAAAPAPAPAAPATPTPVR
ncbi:hypothetical protein P2318_16615 [Myxococcaceae bacterium GXIMD 01537]